MPTITEMDNASDKLIDALKKTCGDLYQRKFTIVRTIDGNFEHMPWEKLYHGMKQLDPHFIPYKCYFGFKCYVTVWKDSENKAYAASDWRHIPSDAPFKGGRMKPIYFEELTPEKAKGLIRKISAIQKEIKEENKLTTFLYPEIND